MSAERRGRLLVVSHPSVISVNQSVYARLLEHGWDISIVVPSRWRHGYSPDDFAPTELPALDGRLIRLPTLLRGHPQRHVYLASAAKILRRIRPDVVYLEEEPFSVPALQWSLAAKRVRIPYGVKLAENRDRSFPLAARLIRRRVLRDARFVAARTPAAVQLATTWATTGTIGLAPHAIADWSAVDRPAHDGFTVGFAGRLVAEKGVEDLCNALARLGQDVRLLAVGEGPLRKDLVELVRGRVDAEFRSYVAHTEMPSVFSEMDVLVLPSRTTSDFAEPFGRVLIEAASCGVPVVGTDSGEIRWVIESLGAGFVVPERDPEALARAIDALHRDPVARSRFAAIGQRNAARLFGLDSAASALDSLLVGALRP